MNIGALVIYHGRPARIDGVSKDKLEIKTAEGDSRSVRSKDVEFLHPGPASSLNFGEAAAPDWQEIIELAEGSTLAFAEFTELAFGENTPAAAMAAWNALKDGTYFTGSVSGGVTPQAPEKVAEMLRKQEEKAREAERRAMLLERIKNNTILPEDRKYLREIEDVGNGISDSSRLMKELELEAVPEKAHKLLNRLGVWDELYDPWPPRLKVEISMPESTLPEDIAEKREDQTAFLSYAIDDAESNDPDDAIAFDSGLLYVHVADPAAAVVPGCAADEEASWRGESSYLPEILSPMLPEGAVERFGLGLQETSPALSFAVAIDNEGRAHLEKIAIAMVRTQRHSYETASETLIKSGDFAELNSALERFKEARRREGALFIRLPEVKTKLRSGVISISPCPVTPERELVANAMLAAGAAAAEFMVENSIPFPFVTQAEPEIDPAVLSDSLADMFELRRNCAAGVAGVIPGRHFGLGLEPYSRVTSPLRRYADLLAHQQIRRYLKGEDLLTSEYIESRLARSEEAGALRRKLEKYANEYYLLHYLKQHPEWSGIGNVVEKQGDRLTIMIPEFAYCYKCRLNTNLKTGDEVTLNFNAADPAAMRLNLRIN